MKWWDQMPWMFSQCWVLSQLIHFALVLSSRIYSGLAFLCDVKRCHATFHIICTGFLFALNKESTAWIAFIYPPNNTSLIRILNVHMQSSYKHRASEKKKTNPSIVDHNGYRQRQQNFLMGCMSGLTGKEDSRRNSSFWLSNWEGWLAIKWDGKANQKSLLRSGADKGEDQSSVSAVLFFRCLLEVSIELSSKKLDIWVLVSGEKYGAACMDLGILIMFKVESSENGWGQQRRQITEDQTPGSNTERDPSSLEEPDKDTERDKPVRTERWKQEDVDFGIQIKRPWRMQISSVHEISQARILEWVAIYFSRESSQPKDWTHVSCIGRQIL